MLPQAASRFSSVWQRSRQPCPPSQSIAAVDDGHCASDLGTRHQAHGAWRMAVAADNDQKPPIATPIRLLQVAFEERGQLGEWNEVDPVVKIHVSGIWNNEQLFRLGGPLVGILTELA